MTRQGFATGLASVAFLRRTAVAASPAQIQRFLRAMVFGGISTKIARLRRKTGLYLVRGTEKLVGSDKAHAVYWRLWPSLRSWTNTEARLRLLAEENPVAVPRFVEIALALNTDPMVLIGLARNPHSRDALAQQLSLVQLTDDSPLSLRIRQRQQYAATFIAAVQLLLDDATAKPLVASALRLQRVVPDAFMQIIYSAGTRTALPDAGLYVDGAMHSGYRQPVGHRLVIVDDYEDAPAVAQLFCGARQVTILALTDLLGSADFSQYVGLGGVESIVVDHLRTRVSRFSEAYVRNHEESRDAALAIADALARHDGLLSHDQHTFMAVALSDFLHFQCLKIAAVKALLADDGFDHIVIGTARHVPTSEYFRLLSGVPELATDPRVELVSIARSMGPKMQFLGGLATLTGRNPPQETRATLPTDMSDTLSELQEHAGRIADRMDTTSIMEADSSSSPTQQKGILLFTANNPAYNTSTAVYAAALAERHRLEIVHFGLRAGPLRTELVKLSDRAAAIPLCIVPAPQKDQRASTARAVVDLLWQVQQVLPDTSARHVMRINAERLVAEVISPQLAAVHGMDLWFARLHAGGALPPLLILAPARLPQIAAMTVIARRYGVPSLTLEAHGLNANYSRYLKVTSDYYGVVSEYFRKDAEAGFGIPADRTAVIGSPRIVAPTDHDPQQAQVAARASLARDQNIPFGQRKATISFFCQPSAWGHVAQVWQSVLMSARTLDLDVLLKTHPEETPTRRELYLRIAAAMSVADQVHVVTGPPDPVIDASDIVLTGYSAAALDAAVRQVPVICVTEGAVDYPVDQHAMIDAPLVRSTAELQAQISAILADPVAARVHAMQFLAREHQFVEGPDERLRAFVDEILAKPANQSLRRSEGVASSVFLDSPHPIFPV